MVFTYGELPSSRAIRLIRFLPGSAPTCQMITVEVEKAPPYAALSYTWGDTIPSTNIIRVDGTEISITDNLADAILAIFAFVRERNMMLWVDRLCINQADVHERSRQVRLMNTIYRSAENVVVWLGRAADDSDLAFDRMREWEQRIDELKCQNGGSEELAVSSISSDDPLFFGPKDSEQGRVLMAIHKLWRRPWWKRAWIVQEGSIAHRTRTILFCGQRRVDWTHLRAAMLITHHNIHVKSHGNSVKFSVDQDMAVILEKLRIDRENGAHIGLLQVLRHIRAYDCRDPRDKVYAALGMAMDVNENDIIPDYTKSEFEVYRDVVQFCLTKSAKVRLDFLGAIWRSAPGTAFEHQYDGDLPSWVPNWKFRAFLLPLEKFLDLDAYGENELAYNACGPNTGSCIIDANCLRLKGYVLDHVTWVSSVCEQRFAAGGLETERSWTPENPDRKYFTGETLMEAFNRTLMTDLGRRDLGSVSQLTRNFSVDWQLVEQSPDTLAPAERQKWAWMIADLKLMTVGRRLFYTSQGFMGLGPPATCIGDQVCVLLGGQVLYVLRESANERYGFIGECYLHGFMDGEACEEEGFLLREIVLV